MGVKGVGWVLVATVVLGCDSRVLLDLVPGLNPPPPKKVKKKSHNKFLKLMRISYSFKGAKSAKELPTI